MELLFTFTHLLKKNFYTCRDKLDMNEFISYKSMFYGSFEAPIDCNDYLLGVSVFVIKRI